MISIDLFGYGGMVFPRTSADFRQMDEVEPFEHVFEAILQPHERVHLVGDSYGSAAALRLVYANSGRVRSLALFEPTAFHILDRDNAARAEVSAVAGAVEMAFASSRLLVVEERQRSRVRI